MSVSPKSQLKQENNKGKCSLRWAGQAGFFIYTASAALAIDLYLSDYLAKKYAGTELPHRRMAPPPVPTENVTGIDLYLCTHKHSDHMDPETFPAVMKNNPGCKAIVPAALAGHAVDLGIDRKRIVSMDAGEIASFPGLKVEVHAISAAHEELQTDEAGRQMFLGYIIDTGIIRLYHSGDCVPYDGLTETLKSLKPDTALMPANGRDEYRRSRNILGNFTIEEAIEICRTAGIQKLFPHHFGMFDFNTANLEELRRIAEKYDGSPLQICIPEIGRIYDCATN